MKPGPHIYYMPIADQIVIAWKKDYVFYSDHAKSLPYTAMEHQKKIKLVTTEQFERDFIYVGEF